MDDLYDTLSKTLRGRSILYVEDDFGVREQYRLFLELLGPLVRVADTLQQAWTYYCARKPDVLIADINLPDGSGMDLVRRIRQLDGRTRVILLTAYTDPHYLIPSVELDVTRYLVKPVGEQELLEALQKAIEQYEKLRTIGATVDLGGGMVYIRETHQITRADGAIQLFAQESRLLGMLCESYPNVLTYERIEHSFGHQPITSNALRILVKKLRLKTCKSLIRNVSGIGYQLQPQ